VTRHWLEPANQWLEVTRQFSRLWLDSTKSWLWLDSKKIWMTRLWLEGLVTLTRQIWLGHITVHWYESIRLCWKIFPVGTGWNTYHAANLLWQRRSIYRKKWQKFVTLFHNSALVVSFENSFIALVWMKSTRLCWKIFTVGTGLIIFLGEVKNVFNVVSNCFLKVFAWKLFKDIVIVFHILFYCLLFSPGRYLAPILIGEFLYLLSCFCTYDRAIF